MKKKSLALAILLTFFTTLMLIACSFDASQPSHAPTLGALAPIAWGPDLDGSYASQKVVGIQGNPLAPPPAGEGGVAIEWDGSSLYWGTAGGSVTPGDAGQFYVTNDAGVATWVYPHGDVDASAADPGALTVNAIQGYGVSASVPTTGNTLRWSGSLWGPAALNLAGGSGYVTGVLPIANQASQTLGGELSGTTASGVVAGPFSTASMSWLASVSAPTWTQATAASDVATQNLKLQAQAPYASAATHVQAGDVVINTAPNVSGTLYGGGLRIDYNSNPQIRLGTYGNGSFGAIYFGSAASSPSLSNWSFLGDGSGTQLNAASVLYLEVAGATFQRMNSSTLTIGDLSTIVITPDQGSGAHPSIIGQGSFFADLTVGTNKSGTALQLQGDAAANVIKLTTAAEMQTQVVYDAVSSPSVPSATQITVYVDTLDNKLKAKDNAGNVTVLAP